MPCALACAILQEIPRPVSDPQAHIDLIERYLDGSLGPDEAKAFERAVATDSALREELRHARNVEASLRRTFTPPSHGILPSIPTTLAVAGKTTDRRVQWAAAAVILLALSAGIYLAANLIFSPSPTHGPRPAAVPVAESLYRSIARAGWQPTWTCETEAEFAQAVADQLGSPMLVNTEDAPDLVLVGWLYPPYGMEPLVSEHTMFLLTTQRNERIMVLIDRAERTTKPPVVSRKASLNVFERTVGDLIAYEITPLEEPTILPRIYIPDRW